MKITAILLIVACLRVSAEGYTQIITLTVKNAPLEKVFKEINKQTGYNFLYSDQDLQKAQTVSLEVKGATLKTVLELCFKDQALEYVISDNDMLVIVRPRGKNDNAPIRSQLEDNLIDVKGRVLNEKDEPVEGATVTVKGTNNGAATNINGVFILKGVDPNAVLVFSGVNIINYEIKVNGKTDLATIYAKTKVKEGEEVLINTGYQKLKPNEVTGSVVQINNEQLSRAVSTDIITRLQGITPGLLTIKGPESKGLEDQRNNIQIRSINTIFSNRQPLIVIDNFPFDGDINSINPNDIESITVLKDAAAASIWGTRAGNGVIVVTTRNGRYNQKPKVVFNSSISIVEKPDFFHTPVLSSSDYIDVETFLFNRGFYNSLINSTSRPPLTPTVEILLKRKNELISPADSAIQLDALRNLDIRNDLLKYYYQKPLKQQYSISLAGGGNNQQYFASIGYDNNINSRSDYDRLSVAAKNTYSLMEKKIEIITGLVYSQTTMKNFPSAPDVTFPYGQIADASGNPLPIARRRQGYIDTVGGGKLLPWTYYPLKERDNADNRTTGFSFRISGDLKYKITKGFAADIKYQYVKQQTDLKEFFGLQSYFTRDLINQYTNLSQTASALRNPVPIGGILDQNNTFFTSQNLRGEFIYNNTWNHIHNLTAIGGAEMGDESTKSNYYRVYGYNDENGTSIPVDFVNKYIRYIDGNPALIPNKYGFSDLVNRTVSLFGNAAYNYKGRYTFSASARRDGANIFGTNTNNQWKPFWSFGGCWNIDKEPFYKIAWLPDLKLRMSYGYQGNVNNTISALLTIIYGPLTPRYRLPSSTIRNLPNPDLKWERIGQFNVGMDYTLIKGRVSGSIEYYRKKGADVIGEEELAPSSGNSITMTNSADIKGKGIDFQLMTSNLTGKLKWSTRFLFSYARDWVSAYKLDLKSVGYYVEGGLTPIAGRPVNALFSYKWAGLDPATGDPRGFLQGKTSNDYVLISQSKDFNDMVYSGPSTAPYFGGVLNTISWGQLSLSFNITYKLGYYFRRPSIFYDWLFYRMDQGNDDYNLRWRKSGDEQFTNVPSLIYPADPNRDGFYRNSNVLIQRADHIRLQDIRLSYDINKRLHNLPFQSADIYVYASNLGILWKANRNGIDPDYVPLNEFAFSLPGRAIAAGMRIDF